nr:pentatricopeptide repeat protein AaPPR1420 [Agave angustifolia]
MNPREKAPSFRLANSKPDPISHLFFQNRIQEAFSLCLRTRSLPSAHKFRSLLSSLPPSIVLFNRLIDLYSKCGSLFHARNVFDEMPTRDICSYNTLIKAYSSAGDLAQARTLFDSMPTRDHFSWSSIISAYDRHRRPMDALQLYRMYQIENAGTGGDKTNKFVMSAALTAAASIGSLQCGKEIHCRVIRSGVNLDKVAWSALADMYAKCGCADNARYVFDRMADRDVVSWTAMIGRYFDARRRQEGLGLFAEMLRSGIQPNDFTFAGVLDVCGEIAAEGLGKEIHGHMTRVGYDPSSFAAAALVDMYSKCGNVEKAQAFFESIPKPDLVSWTSLISRYAQNGQPEKALEKFDRLLQMGLKPDHVTFVGVLSACTHAGLVDRGLKIFHSITDEFGISHTADHYACAVDLLSRSGRFQEAEEIINKMPTKPDKFLWASLLSGCRIHKNLPLAKRAAEALFEIEPENAATYVTLANIYASSGNWNEVERIRKRMDKVGVVKKPGASWIEVKRRVHEFVVGDFSHPRIKEIYSELETLYKKMKEKGYVPDTNFVLHDVEEEQKEQNLTYHSERLAVAFGIIATPKGTSIKVFKNLRICGDCHAAIKFVSSIAERVIVVRDSSRFHHFKDGICFVWELLVGTEVILKAHSSSHMDFMR